MSDRRVLVPSVALGLALGCQLNASSLGTNSNTTTTLDDGPDPSTGPGTTIPPVPTTDPPDGSGGSTSNSTTPTGGSDSTGSDDGEGSSGGELEPWPRGPFGPAVRVDSLSHDMFNDDDPSLTGDWLEIVFASNRSGDSEDLYSSIRLSVTDDWVPPQLITGLSTADAENTPEISSDGLVLMFASDRDFTGGMDLFISYRTARDQAWGDPVHLPELSSPELDIAPTLSFYLDTLHWCSRRTDGVGFSDIWRADVRRVGGALVFGSPQIVPGINTLEGECAMSASPDRLIMFYDSDREIDGALRIWESSRASTEDPFDYGFVHDELTGATMVDIDPWVSADGHLIYWSSTRDGNQDIYYAAR